MIGEQMLSVHDRIEGGYGAPLAQTHVSASGLLKRIVLLRELDSSQMIRLGEALADIGRFHGGECAKNVEPTAPEQEDVARTIREIKVEVRALSFMVFVLAMSVLVLAARIG